MITATMKFKLLSLATKYGVEIDHFTPGHVVLWISNWHSQKHKIIPFIEELQTDQNIRNITWHQGNVEVFYNPNALEDRSAIQNWIRIFEKYSF